MYLNVSSEPKKAGMLRKSTHLRSFENSEVKLVLRERCKREKSEEKLTHHQDSYQEPLLMASNTLPLSYDACSFFSVFMCVVFTQTLFSF